MKQWEKALKDLKSADPELAILFNRYPDRLNATSDAFRTLANAVVGQQISVKAGDAIWNRLENRIGAINPENVVRVSPEDLRSCGLSVRKVEYLSGIAKAFLERSIDPVRWTNWNDNEVLDDLVSLRGIGRWTAEMILIFHLNRPDVLPLDDVALVRAAARHFGWPGDKQAATRLAERGETWRPWRTVAVWYLWRTQDKEPVQY